MTELKTERLVLKPPTDGDKHALVEHLNDFEVVRWLSNVPHPYTLLDAEEWIEIVAASASNDVLDFRLSVFLGDALIGGVGLVHRESNVYELGYWLARAFWGRGIATEAAAGLLRHAQRILPDAKFVAHCMEGNRASANVLEKLGFCVAGETEIHSVSLGTRVQCAEYGLK
jgi:RimJ/RimL family protein N-acetyltransferase